MQGLGTWMADGPKKKPVASLGTLLSAHRKKTHLTGMRMRRLTMRVTVGFSIQEAPISTLGFPIVTSGTDMF